MFQNLRLLFAVAVLICAFGFNAQSQRVCGTDEYIHSVYNTTKKARAARPTTTAGRDLLPNEIVTIPVVIHVLYNQDIQNISEAQIRSQLDALNKDFRKQNADGALTPDAFKPFAADAQIVFCLAQVDPANKRTTGIIRKYTSKDVFFADDAMKFSAQGGDNAWDNTKYLNIWICNMGGRTLGYATPPGGDADRDGVVIGYDVFGTTGVTRAPFNKGRTATHEIAHWLGLQHIWGDTNCGDDGIDDTPQQKSYNFGCPTFPHVTTCSPNANGDMFMNYMDFTDDGCMNMFTTGQKNKMRAVFGQTGVRNSFLYAQVCDSTMVQGGPLPEPEPAPVPPVVVKPTVTKVKIFPNPVITSASITSTMELSLAGKDIYIYNSQGVQVYHSKITGTTGSINLSGFGKGMYMIKIGEGRNATMIKVMHP